MNAQVFFIEGQFSLIHIPLPLYSTLLQPILQTLLPSDDNDRQHGSSSTSSPSSPHAFLNISITPIECSIVCLSTLAASIFEPYNVSLLTTSSPYRIQISTDTYNIFSVSSAGMEAGQRVMDLTAPLAMAGIPIFFITTYYTDFILVPSKDRATVGQALLARGFEFEASEGAYVAPMSSVAHSRGGSGSGSIHLDRTDDTAPPRTPPPSSVAELQTRTFAQLKKRNVIPFVVPDLHLVQCSGREENFATSHSHSHSQAYRSSTDHTNGHSHPNSHPSTPSRRRSLIETIDPRLYVGLIAALVQQPRFLSVTLTHDDAPSLLLDKELLHLFGTSIAGDTEGDLVPIFLDLLRLPLESTGIVCGVAGKLGRELGVEGEGEWGEGEGKIRAENGAEGGSGGGSAESYALDKGDGFGAELSYLSTARAGAVILSAEAAGRALAALRPLMDG